MLWNKNTIIWLPKFKFMSMDTVNKHYIWIHLFCKKFRNWLKDYCTLGNWEVTHIKMGRKSWHNFTINPSPGTMPCNQERISNFQLFPEVWSFWTIHLVLYLFFFSVWRQLFFQYRKQWWSYNFSFLFLRRAT